MNECAKRHMGSTASSNTLIDNEQHPNEAGRAAMNQLAVTVIIPAFNAAKTLLEAVSSVLAQSITELECLVIDDGSKDDTLSIAESLASSDSRVRVLCHPNHENRGVAASRNLGLDEAKGEFIAFLDADDAWLPHKLAAQLDVLARRPDIGCVFGDVYVCDSPDPMRRMSEQPMKVEPFRASMAEMFNGGRHLAAQTLSLHPDSFRLVPSPTPLVRGALFADGLRFIGKPKLSLQYEDFLMWRVLSMRTGFYCLAEALAIYRVHGASFTGQFQKHGSTARHLLGLEQVQVLFVETCADTIDEDFLKAMAEQNGLRMLRGAHRVQWRELPAVLNVARRYGCSMSLLRRRIVATAVEMRMWIGKIRRKLGRSAKA